MWQYYVYYTPTVRRYGKPTFKFQYELNNAVGFRSVYMFLSREARYIQQQGNLRSIQHLPVGSKELYVDFDNNAKAASDFMQWLFTHNIRFTKWDSGNRSVHFHIDINLMHGIDVPWSQLCWMREHAEGFDETIYRHTALWRLPGTPHEKNWGRAKKCVGSYGGYPLDIPYKERHLIAIPSQTPEEAARSKLYWGLKVTKMEGGRRVFVWWLAAMCHDAGLTVDEATDKILKWNHHFAIPPLADHIVRKKIDEAYDSRQHDITRRL